MKDEGAAELLCAAAVAAGATAAAVAATATATAAACRCFAVDAAAFIAAVSRRSSA